LNTAFRWLGILLLAGVSGCGRPPADALASARARGQLRWGGDEEGGGPYIYRSEADARVVTGFEFDLMRLLSAGLGLESNFESSNWPELLKTLNTGTLDVVVNGYELTPERLRDQIATIPYYAYELHLFVPRAGSPVGDWEDLRKPRPAGGRWRIGVLKNTAADDYMTRSFQSVVDVRRYEGTTDAFRDVENGALDGTVTDTPPAVYYGTRFQVKQAGAARERGWYVMYLRPGDEPLRDALNDGLRRSFRDGTYRAILERYGLWTQAQEELLRPDVEELSERLRPVTDSLAPWEVVRSNLPLLLKAAGMTVLLSVLSMPLAISLGLLIAIGRQYGPLLVRGPLTVYVEVVRGTPLLLQLYFVHFGIVPLLGLPDAVRAFAPIVSAVVGLSLNYAAYESEIYRAGLAAVPRGQTEAALALGLSRWQAVRHVIVPQAVRMVIPPVTNDFINLFKDTSICSVIAVEELSKRYNIASNDSPRSFAHLALVTALLYLCMSYPLSMVARRMEERPRKGGADA
jgi:polar amino acid transport system substrate-binding protein